MINFFTIFAPSYYISLQPRGGKRTPSDLLQLHFWIITTLSFLYPEFISQEVCWNASQEGEAKDYVRVTAQPITQVNKTEPIYPCTSISSAQRRDKLQREVPKIWHKLPAAGHQNLNEQTNNKVNNLLILTVFHSTSVKPQTTIWILRKAHQSYYWIPCQDKA